MQRLVLHPHLKQGRGLAHAQLLRYIQRLDPFRVYLNFLRNFDVRRRLKVLLEAKCVADFGCEGIGVRSGGDGADEGATSLE